MFKFMKKKEMALNTIIFAMQEVLDNLQKDYEDHRVKTNTEAMNQLSSAFEKVYKL